MLLFKKLTNNAPVTAGVYIIKNKFNEIIYIGKAKNINKRLRSYLKTNISKTQSIVSNAASFEFISTSNELEALLLESNLIKKHKPRYNILLKDDKAYLYIAIDKNKKFPMLELIRKKNSQKICFGPYVSGKSVKLILSVLNKVFPLRKCKDSVFKISKKPCIYYQMQYCSAPCVDFIESIEYQKLIKKIEKVLKGNFKNIINDLEKEMLLASDNLDFEKASLLRDKLKALEILKEKQSVVLNSNDDIDLLTLKKLESIFVLNVLIVRNGVLLGQNNYSFDVNIEANELIERFLVDYYLQNIVPPQILVNFKIPSTTIVEFLKDAKIIESETYKDHTNLLPIVEQNILEFSKNSVLNVSEKLARLLHLLELHKIECYDMSNLSGTNCVGAKVVFINGEMFKTLYRKYKIKTSTSADDLKMMQEVVSRRIKDLDPLPDLIILDGGKTQINAVKDLVNVPIISIAKNKKGLRDKIYYLKNSKIIKIEPDDDVLFFIMRIRDETHRFVLSFHRKLRDKVALASELNLKDNL